MLLIKYVITNPFLLRNLLLAYQISANIVNRLQRLLSTLSGANKPCGVHWAVNVASQITKLFTIYLRKLK